jgi:hypothetical protein
MMGNCCTELHQQIIELQLARAVAVVQHPAIAAKMASGDIARRVVSSKIAHAMITSLDKVAVLDGGETVYVDPLEVEELEHRLEQVTLMELGLAEDESRTGAVRVFKREQRVSGACVCETRTRFLDRARQPLKRRKYHHRRASVRSGPRDANCVSGPDRRTWIDRTAYPFWSRLAAGTFNFI